MNEKFNYWDAVYAMPAFNWGMMKKARVFSPRVMTFLPS